MVFVLYCISIQLGIFIIYPYISFQNFDTGLIQMLPWYSENSLNFIIDPWYYYVYSKTTITMKNWNIGLEIPNFVFEA